MSKNKIRYSKAVINFIADKIESGMSLSECCRKYPDQCPEEKTVYRWKRNHEFARVTLDTAYQTLLVRLIDKIIDLSNAPLPDTTDKMELLRADKERRLQLDSLKFLASKITPKMVPKYGDKVTVENTGGPQFVLVDYSAPVVKDITPIVPKLEDKDD